ncbi:MAG: SGNH/GDSL hydrolase family protein [Rhodocyclaceae bacterium]|nr:SGNH/GDSL hydrolase family protein [Rhodocyclaceae bacterium]MDZ4215563.1 SGNH/GDSL hydrolase family protein [Rhodocyclaceae bacterium]
MRLTNVVLFLASLALSALLAEGVFRVVVDDGMVYELEMWKYAKSVKVRSDDPSIGHQHRPNAAALLMGAQVRTDSHGFRGTDIPGTPTSGVARIAFVGDSITFGWGVAEEETFASRVVNDLQSRGRRVDGFNLGVGNFNTSQELALFKAVGLEMKPDIVVLAYFINDAEPLPRYNQHGWLDWHSAAWTVLAHRADSVLRSGGSRQDWKEYYRGLYRNGEEGWDSTRRATKELAETVRASGADLIAFNIPELRELKPYPFVDINEKITDLMRSNNIPLIDLLPAVEGQEPPSLWVTVPDPHPNGKANDLFATAMVRSLVPILQKLCEQKGKGC